MWSLGTNLPATWIITELVRERQATAIIVSHDIDLAVKYADEIVMIHRVNNTGMDDSYGLINNHSICMRSAENEWILDNNRYASPEMSEILKQHLA